MFLFFFTIFFLLSVVGSQGLDCPDKFLGIPAHPVDMCGPCILEDGGCQSNGKNYWICDSKKENEPMKFDCSVGMILRFSIDLYHCIAPEAIPGCSSDTA